MPVITIAYMPDDGCDRRSLAIALIRDLPDIIVEQVNGIAGTNLGPGQMTIDIRQFDPNAYNQPDVEVAIMIGHGPNDSIYGQRAQVRRALQRRLSAWLFHHPELRDAAALKVVDVDLRFVDMCGVSFEATTGGVREEWGGPDDM